MTGSTRKGRQILEQTGAEHIAQTGETKGDFGNSDRPTAPIEHVAAADVAPEDVVVLPSATA